MGCDNHVMKSNYFFPAENDMMIGKGGGDKTENYGVFDTSVFYLRLNGKQMFTCHVEAHEKLTDRIRMRTPRNPSRSNKS